MKRRNAHLTVRRSCHEYQAAFSTDQQGGQGEVHYLRGSWQFSVSKGDTDQDLQHDAGQDEAGDRNQAATVSMPRYEPVYQDAGKQDQPGR